MRSILSEEMELLCWNVHGAKEHSRERKQESQVKTQKSTLGKLYSVGRAAQETKMILENFGDLGRVMAGGLDFFRKISNGKL